MIIMELPIYGGTIKFFTETTEYEEECITLDIPDHDLEEGILGIFNKTAKDDGTPVYLIGVFDNKTTTLVHELGHMCLDVCEHRGFSAHDGNGEPFCYMLDYLFRLFEQHLNVDTNHQPE